MSHLAPGPQRVGMVPVDEDRAPPADQRVEPAGDADGEALHAPRERDRVIDFDDEVQVVALDGVVHDAHPEPQPGLAKSVLEKIRALVRAQIADAWLHAHGHVHRMPRSDLYPLQMWNTRSAQPWMRMLARPPRSFASATPLRQRERELSHHDV